VLPIRPKVFFGELGGVGKSPTFEEKISIDIPLIILDDVLPLDPLSTFPELWQILVRDWLFSIQHTHSTSG